MPEIQHGTWGKLLRDAVEKPGRMLESQRVLCHHKLPRPGLLGPEQESHTSDYTFIRYNPHRVSWRLIHGLVASLANVWLGRKPSPLL